MAMEPCCCAGGRELFNQNNIFFTEPAMLDMLDVHGSPVGPQESLRCSRAGGARPADGTKLFKGNALGKRLRYDSSMTSQFPG